MALPSAILQRGTRAAQPAAASVAAGVTYCVTDENFIIEQSDGAAWQQASATGAGTGDVNGPASSVDKEVALFDGTSGKLLEAATGTGIARVTSGVWGTPGNVVESEITLADNTTNNAATTKHGFLKKLSNVATEYMDGTGAWSVPAGGGGGLTLVEEHTASASATLDFTTGITSTYDEYVLVVTNLVNATNNQDLWLRVSTDGGSTFETTLYEYVYWNNSTSNVGIAATASTSDSKIILFPGIDNTQSYGSNCRILISDPLNAALHKSFEFTGRFPLQAVARRYYQTGGGFWGATTAVNAIRLLYASGNITSGTARLYGLEK